MKISIVTPSFRNSDWLKLCVASVADQAGVEVEHIVQDAQSDDGTQEWLARDRRVQAYFEKDQGMYDAVNRGWRRAKGEILAYLNCDEQYLPGGLRAVEEFFRRRPQTDVVFADTVVVDKQGQFICCRKSLVPWKNTMWVYNPVISSSIFIHRRVLDQHGLFFDTRWRDLGDKVWTVEMVRRGLNMAVLRQFTSSFTDTGENMNLKPNALRERELVMDNGSRLGPALQVSRCSNSTGCGRCATASTGRNRSPTRSTPWPARSAGRFPCVQADRRLVGAPPRRLLIPATPGGSGGSALG